MSPTAPDEKLMLVKFFLNNSDRHSLRFLGYEIRKILQSSTMTMALAGSCSAKISTSRMNFLNRLSQESEGCWIIAATSRAAGARNCNNDNFKSTNFNQHFSSIVSSTNNDIGWVLQREHQLLADDNHRDRVPYLDNTKWKKKR